MPADGRELAWLGQPCAPDRQAGGLEKRSPQALTASANLQCGSLVASWMSLKEEQPRCSCTRSGGANDQGMGLR